ncbi:putative oxidoreductase [Gammaproteobacteria bacterium]|nr:putative oxidoreductase [Gammaproteobacteria bacterium]
MSLFAPLNPPLPAWADARVWIVGASTGIGAAAAKLMLARGARVALSARSADKLADVAGDAAASGRAIVEPLDVTDHASVVAAWERVRTRWDGIDLVLVVAGTHEEIRAWELTDGNARALLEVNLHGPIGAVAAVVPALLAQGRGTIAIVASLAGYRGLPKALVYGASKAALINFAEALHLDLRPRGLGVALINPGFVKTPLTDRNAFPMPYLISAEEAAAEIVAGLERGDFEIDFPKAFSRRLGLLRLLPYRWYFAVIRKATGL